jgi:diguanylate cyclase (GGDEF)-like protein
MSLAARTIQPGDLPTAIGEGDLQHRLELLESVNASLRRSIVRLQGEVATTRRLAYHDALTGLPNRHLLRDRLDQGVLRASREGTQVALLLIDLDRFKSVNDELGHDAGDQLLCEVAERLLRCTRGADTVCRYGGDEFVVMLPGVTAAEEAEHVAQKIRACIDHVPFAIEGRAVKIGASVGVAMLRPGDAAIERLIRDADRAMYRAKYAARAGAAGVSGRPSAS